jgi:hypothetical protein
MGKFTINCNGESRRISCMLVDCDKMYKISAKWALNKKNPINVFLICLHVAEDLVTIKRDFGEISNSNNLSRSLRADVTEEPQG